MAFFRKLFSGGGKAKKKEYPNIIEDVDPLESWMKVGELGDGAFGKVFKTEHRETGKLAAMKRVPIQDDSELDDFMVEIDVLAECKHPNIVGLHEAYYYDSALWIYIEFCAGGAMDDIIVELDHGLAEPQIVCITRQLFEALSFLHSRSCIHRDLKAGNILLCPDGSIRLADFGVSVKDGSKGKKHDTFIGTPYWMAPEVVVCETVKDDPYDSSADIWSAGITLIELADMNPPYHEMSPMRVLQKIVKKDPPTVAVPSRWSSNFNDIIKKCLNKIPSARGTAEQLLQHPLIADVTDYKPLRILYQEVKSEVEEIMEELPEDADLTVDPEHSQDFLTDTPARKQSTDTPTRGDPGATPTEVESSPVLPPVMTVQEPSPPPVQEPSSPSTQEPSPPPAQDHEAPNQPAPEQNTATSEPAETPAVTDVSPPEPPTLQQALDERRASEGSEQSRQRERTPSSSSDEKTGDKLGTGGSDFKYATLSRVRKFKVDNQVMLSTTKKIVDVTANRTLRDNKKYQQMRKQDFRELKQLRREEMKEATEYFNKIKADKEALEKKFDVEVMDHEKRYEAELESLKKRQKKQADKLDVQHVQLYKAKVRSIKAQQAKELKRFKENLKEEEKLAVKRTEQSAAKADRKSSVSQVKIQLQEKRAEKEDVFSSQQAASHESQVGDILRQQLEETKQMELGFLDSRHDTTRNFSSMKWEMEQRHKQETHQLMKQQLREAFHMQRHQMQVRHQMEVELQNRRNQFQLEELRQSQIIEKRQLPKRLKLEHKQKVAEARKALRNKKGDKEALRLLDEQYVQKCQTETDFMTEKHEKDMETLKLELDTNMKELQEIQNEKKMTLTQQETNKVKERDEQHTQELRDWRADIAKRKQKLEDGFEASRMEKEEHFAQQRPGPKQLRSSFSFSERTSRTTSMTSVDPNQSLPISLSGASRPAINPLDEVVLGTPPLSHANDKTPSAQNGKST